MSDTTVTIMWQAKVFVIISASVNMFDGSNTITVEEPLLTNTQTELVSFLQLEE